jgi:hypothetical protein
LVKELKIYNKILYLPTKDLNLIRILKDFNKELDFLMGKILHFKISNQSSQFSLRINTKDYLYKIIYNQVKYLYNQYTVHS